MENDSTQLYSGLKYEIPMNNYMYFIPKGTNFHHVKFFLHNNPIFNRLYTCKTRSFMVFMALAYFIKKENYAYVKKKQLVELLGISEGCINNCLTELKRNDLIRKQKNDLYMLNPYIVSRANWLDIIEIREEWDLNVNKKSIYTLGNHLLYPESDINV